MLRLPRRNTYLPLYAAGLCAHLACGVSQPAKAQTTRIEAIRFWSFSDLTRVAIETTGEYTIHTEQLANPARLYFDLRGLKPPVDQAKGMHTIQVGDHLVQRIRVAETSPGVTRVVFDLQTEADVTSSQLANPDRLVIEIRGKGRKSGEINVSKTQMGSKRFDTPPDEPTADSSPDFAASPVKPGPAPTYAALPKTDSGGGTASKSGRADVISSPRPGFRVPELAPKQPEKTTPDLASLFPPPAIPYLVPMLSPTLRALVYSPMDHLTNSPVPPYRGSRGTHSATPSAVADEVNGSGKSNAKRLPKIAPADGLPVLDSSTPVKQPATVSEMPSKSSSAGTSSAGTSGTSGTSGPGASVALNGSGGSASAPAKIDSSGNRSLVRVFGLKMGKVVIDAGHGGHDTGTIGRHGLLEKDLVLDVALRLGQLIQTKLGSQVVYTRTDDTFIPLEQRTQIANDEKADLFISIHANSAPILNATGVETYYFNFTTEKAALDLATRENATAASSIHELNDLVQQAVLKAKVEESREFAQKVQGSLYGMSAKMNSSARDRGVRKAPFVVLIGATMPSILAEVGFVSNPHDEPLLKKAEQRQKIAEALFKGIEQYSNTLSHVQMARTKSEGGE